MVSEVINKIIIEVNIGYWELMLTASISKIKNRNGLVNPQAYAEFEAFVDTIEGLMVTYDFEIMEDSISDVSKISRYYYFYPRDKKTGELKNKFLIIFRLSDHATPELSKDMKIRRNKYFQTKSKEYSKRTDDYPQAYKVLNVVVNNKTFADYDEAIDAIDELFNKLRS